MTAWHHHRTLLLTLLLGVGAARADKEAFASMPAKDFLAYVRSPFRQDMWGKFEGKISYKSPTSKGTLPIKLAMRLQPDSFRARAVVNGADVYDMRSQRQGGRPTLNLIQPSENSVISLAELGLSAEDFTFSFLFWDLAEELPKDTIRGQSCRVLRLVHPSKKTVAVAWIVTKYLFPLRVDWYTPDAEKPWRTCEFTDFKKFDKDFWFLKTLKMRGDDWKTKVTFTDAELSPSDQTPPPEDLFVIGPATITVKAVD